MGRHAADMIAILDHLGLGAVHVCGMSMGGFVAVASIMTMTGARATAELITEALS
jgi:pimeloyl-ACP methyl ester carboxylesterase